MFTPVTLFVLIGLHIFVQLCPTHRSYRPLVHKYRPTAAFHNVMLVPIWVYYVFIQHRYQFSKYLLLRHVYTCFKLFESYNALQGIAKKLQERMLKWFGHVMRREEQEGGRWKWKHKGEVGDEYLREDGWTKWRMISKRRDCRLMKCTTVCHRTSTPHKSGNKMKEKIAL